MDFEVIGKLLAALGLGLLVGFQRERRQASIAGLRTFALISLFGALCGYMGELYNSAWIVGSGIVAIVGVFVIGNIVEVRQGKATSGMTTEISALLMFGVGALMMIGSTHIATTLGGTIAIILHFKESLHGLVRKIGEEDVRKIMEFVLVSVVILPMIPNRSFGPNDVINLFQIWLLVVLIIGLGLCGYLMSKIFGARMGNLLSGFFGGLVSSTAVTLAYSKQSRRENSSVMVATLAIFTASVVVYLRMIVELSLVARSHVQLILPPFFAMLAYGAVLIVFLWRRFPKDQANGRLEPSNPVSIRTAIAFALLYAIILMVVPYAKGHLGSSGVYGVAIISGLVDIDAITLSTAKLITAGHMQPDLGWRSAMVASLSNISFKFVLAAVLGNRELTKQLSYLFGLLLAGGLALLSLWPG